MKIDIRQLQENEPVSLEGEESPSILDQKSEWMQFTSPIRYSLEVTKSKNDLLVTGELATSYNTVCARCLKPLKRTLAIEDFNVHEEIGGRESVDLTSQIREDMLLELPQKVLCVEDCKGLCPVCGQNLNEKQCQCVVPPANTAWSKLDELKR